MSAWEDFENDLAEYLGLNRVPGSGNQWHSKLDVRGKETLWSLKCTKKDGFRISKNEFDEAIIAAGGIGGGGEVPIWAVRIEGYEDFVIMRLSEWKGFMKGEVDFSVPLSKAEQRRARAFTPQLERNND